MSTADTSSSRDRGFERQLRLAAIAAAVAGALATVPVLPSAVRGVLMLGFVLAGPGSAGLLALGWSRSRSFVLALAPVIGIAAWIIVITAATLAEIWYPSITLLILAFATAGIAQLGWTRRDRWTGAQA